MSGAASITPLLPPGSRLGPYEILRLLGSGAFADVYLARNTLLEKEFALKVLRAPESEAGDLQGARIMCRLQHPNIVSVQFADRIEGRLVIAMDYVEGKTLRGILKERAPLDLDRSLEIAATVVNALEYVQSFELKGSAGLGHLDLKPSNILVDSKGATKITDFGMAQAFHHESDEIVVTGGSPAYMAPEQYEGKPSKQSDIWAVGVLLYEMLIGHPPFRADSVEEYRRRICTSGPEMSARFYKLPGSVQEVILRCLKRNPGERFPSARDLCAAIASARARSIPAVCSRCGAELPVGSSVCSDCTFPEEKHAARFDPLQHASKAGVPHRKILAWILLAVFAVLAASVTAGYQLWKRRKPLQISPQGTVESGRPDARLTDRGPAIQTAPTPADKGAAQGAIDGKPLEVMRAKEEWKRIQELEKAVGGSYQDRHEALQDFLRKYETAAEAKTAAVKLALWDQESQRFREAEDREANPAAKICEKLAGWNEFLALQKTGFQRARAVERIRYWTTAVEDYSGYAALTVKSAIGLPPSDIEFFGGGQPEPFFALLEKKKILYESSMLKNNPAPIWEETARVFISPTSGLILEIRDADLIGYDLLFHREISTMPVDGPFTLTNGTIKVQLQVMRER
jgi:hypothetical protein